MILEIEVEKTADNIPVIHLKGEIDLHTCGGFRDTSARSDRRKAHTTS